MATMDLGAIEVQIFVSLILVLGALFVALVCDFLKGNNESLREQNIVLSVRQQERERFQQQPAASQRRAEPAPSPPIKAARPAQPPKNNEYAARVVAPPVAAPELPTPPAFKETAPPLLDEEPRPESANVASRPKQWATDDEQAQIERLAADIRNRVSWTAGESEPSRTDTRDEREETRGPSQQEPSTGKRTLSHEPPAAGDSTDSLPGETATHPDDGPGFPLYAKVTPIDVVAAERAAATEAIQLARELERVAEMTNSTQTGDLDNLLRREAALESPKEKADTADQTSGSQNTTAVDVSLETEAEVPVEEVSSREQSASEPAKDEPPVATTPENEVPAIPLSLPHGFRDYSELGAAMKNEGTFAGTVVSIAVQSAGPESAAGANQDSANSLIDGVDEFIESLLTADGFACQSGPNEYIMVLTETGSDAQRRLQFISQRLWDYQIRSVGSQSVMFSWGSGETVGGSFSETVESAKEQMQQTRRTRQRAPMEIASYRRRAAND